MRAQLGGLLETLRGATRATLSTTQPAMHALHASLLQPLLRLQVGEGEEGGGGEGGGGGG
jgi:hypothetical protein